MSWNDNHGCPYLAGSLRESGDDPDMAGPRAPGGRGCGSRGAGRGGEDRGTVEGASSAACALIPIQPLTGPQRPLHEALSSPRWWE